MSQSGPTPNLNAEKRGALEQYRRYGFQWKALEVGGATRDLSHFVTVIAVHAALGRRL